MRVFGLDGREYVWKLAGRRPAGGKKSAGHLACRRLLAELYPFEPALEEVPLPGCLLVSHAWPLRMEVS